MSTTKSRKWLNWFSTTAAAIRRQGLLSELKNRAKAPRLKESHFRMLIDKNADAMVVISQNGEVRFVNPAAEGLFGKEAEEMIDEKFGFPVVAGAAEEVNINRDDGKTTIAEMRVVESRWEGKTAYLVSLRDITKNAEVEIELRKRNEFINTILDNLPIGIAVNSIDDGSARYMNSKFEEIYGWPKDVLLSVEKFFNHVYPDAAYRKAIRDRVMSDIASGDPSRMLWENVIATGQTGEQRIVSAKNIPLIEQNLMISTVQDVTARKQAEEQLLKLSHAIEQSPSAIFIYDADGKVEYVNPKFTQLTGMTLEEAISIHVSSLGDLSQEENRQIWETIMRGQEWRGEILNRKKSGEAYWVFSSISPIREAGGTITHFVEIHEDITAKKLAEKRIRQQAEDLALLNSVNTAINRGASLQEVIQLLVEESKRIFSSYGVAVHLLSADKRHMILQNSPLPPVTVMQIEKLIGMEIPPVKIPLKAGSIFLDILKSGKSRLVNSHESIQQLILEFTQSIPLSNNRSHISLQQLTPKIRRILGEEIKSVMIVSLISEGESHGLLGMYRHEPFTEADLLRFETIAGQLTTAIHRATLHEQTERRLRRLNAMRNIDRAITASLDLEQILNILLDQVKSQLGVDAASVLLLKPNTQMLEYTAGRGFRTDGIQHTRLRIGEDHAGRAALERQLVNVPDLRGRKTGFLRSPLIGHEGFITYYCVPLIVKGMVKGVLEIFHRKLLVPDLEWLDFLEALAGQAAIAIDEASLFIELQRSNDELTLAYDSTLEGWVHALDLRDKETKGHTQRVTEMTLRLARAMDMSEEELVHVRRGALLHDIGKIGIPDSILHKPGPLDDDEWKIIQKHPFFANELLSPIDYLQPALDIPYCHHEKWDGTGYPRGLKDEEIPLAARIFAVADVWDALRSDRPYRQAWSEEKAIEYIAEQAGKHLDPQVVEVFLQVNGFRANPAQRL